MARARRMIEIALTLKSRSAHISFVVFAAVCTDMPIWATAVKVTFYVGLLTLKVYLSY